MENQTEQTKVSTGKLTTLKDFIDDHQKILAVTGVFIALSVYFSNAPLKEISLFLSFLCLASTIPLLFQIYQNFNFKKSSWLLVIFMNIFTPLVAYIFWYLLIAYRPFWKTQTSNVLLWFLLIPLWYILRQLNVQKLVASWVQLPITTILNTLTDLVIVRSRKPREKLINEAQIPDEEKQRLWKEQDVSNEAFRKTQYERDKEQAAKDARIPANLIVGIILFICCNFIANRLGSIINYQLDTMYESYKATEQPPTPTPTPNLATPSTTYIATPSPMPSPSPESTPMPDLAPTPEPKRRPRRRR